MLVFGVQQFIYKVFVAGLGLVPESIPAHTFCAFFIGAVLMLAGVSIGLGRHDRLSALMLGITFFVIALVRRGPEIEASLHDLSKRTVLFETLALCGASLLIAAAASAEPAPFQGLNEAARRLASAGRYLVAISMIIFGIDHFQVAAFVASLIPAWIPWHLFWAYFTGLALIAAGISIALGKLLRPSGMLLGFMFLLWVVLLHAPRVVLSGNNGNEWNSASVALAMSGCGFRVASLRGAAGLRGPAA